MGLKIFRFARCVHVFVVFGHRRSSWRKKQILAQKNFEKMQYFVFFSRAPRTSFDHQNLQAPCALKPLWRQINSIFLNFFAIFSNLLFIGINYYFFLCHELPECPTNTKLCTRLADMTIFDPTKFHIFLIFLLFFLDGQSTLTGRERCKRTFL